MIVVTPKIHPDLDGYACAYAYSEFLNKSGNPAIGISLGDLQKEITFLNQEFNIPRIPNNTEIVTKAEQIILVDASSLKGMPEGIDPTKVNEIIDHRSALEVKRTFPNAKIQIEQIGAAATLIVEKFNKDNVSMSKQATVLLYGAIASNTLNFQASVATEKDKVAFTWLAKSADLSTDLIHRMFIFKSQFDDASFEKQILSDFKEVEINGKLVGIAQLEVVGLKNILGERKTQILQILDSKSSRKKKTSLIFS